MTRHDGDDLRTPARMTRLAAHRSRWLLPAVVGLVVCAATGPLAHASWRRAVVLEAVTEGPAAVARLAPKDAVMARTLTAEESAQVERAKAVLFGMIAAVALLPLIPFIREWMGSRQRKQSQRAGEPSSDARREDPDLSLPSPGAR